jgi:hypothetical protein
VGWVTFLLWSITTPARCADWLEVGDRGLRSDVEILAAYGLIDDIVTTWPIPKGQLLSGLSNTKRLGRQPAYVQEAAQRVLKLLNWDDQSHGVQPIADAQVTNSSDVIRDFGGMARNDADFAGGVDWTGNWVSARLLVGDQSRFNGAQSVLTFDGSFATADADNWLVYAGWVDQWYGPGWTSSLILSNNARPIPKVGIMRGNPHAFETPWLSWLGPWQINFFVGLLDGPRIDRNTGLGSLRLTFNPAAGLEVGLTRATEFCGEHHPCNPLNAAFHVDNGPKSTNQTNDEATIEFKYTRAITLISVSPYVQLMNEDTGPFTHSYTSYLAGLSVAGPWREDGARWRFTAELADSVATLNWFDFGKKAPGTAYNNYSYLDGFRYRDRTLGFSLDSDSRLFSLAAQLTGTTGFTYRLVYYRAFINTRQLAAIEAVDPTTTNVVSAQPVQFNQAEAGISMPWHYFRLEMDLRAQDRQPYPHGGGLFSAEAGLRYGF